MEATRHVPPSIVATATLGIDLSSKRARTAACRIDWTRDGGVVAMPELGLDDGALMGLVMDPAVRVVGIDAPFGWPDPFVAALVAHRDHGHWPIGLDCYDDQRPLILRTTDLAVKATTEQQPLSVSTDRLAFAALRAARLLSALRDQGVAVDRDGTGKVVEVYPAAALRGWGLSPDMASDDRGGYKGKTEAATVRRRKLVARLRERTSPWLELSDKVAAACDESDDRLDALVCSLIARAVEKRLCDEIPAEHQAIARSEGWIMVPTATSLANLAACGATA